jgi:hypothetical protein
VLVGGASSLVCALRHTLDGDVETDPEKHSSKPKAIRADSTRRSIPRTCLIGAGIGTLTRRLWPVLPQRSATVPPSADRRRSPADPEGRNVTIVVNSSSGSGASDVTERVRERLPAARIVELDSHDELARLLEEAAGECEVLGIAGGDGSIATAVAIAVAHSRPLLALPGGTLNHLTRDLRIEDVDDALDALAAGETVGVDVATIDGQLFINGAGLGAYPE